MKRKPLTWPPPDEKITVKRGRRKRTDGEPQFFQLHKFENDRPIRATQSQACCDCGLIHLMAYEVFREQHTGNWWLVSRAYRTGRLGKVAV